MDIRRIKIIFFFTFAALLFSCTEYTWAITSSETAKLLASDGAMNDQFGTSISVDGDTAVSPSTEMDVPNWSFIAPSLARSLAVSDDVMAQVYSVQENNSAANVKKKIIFILLISI